ncbi:MAG TPA: nicotinate phosphoribosyltransferase [Bacteroidales bacterium]|nr:nicotinate phosphoribosyltransferase [Bacteroidales bacterium]
MINSLPISPLYTDLYQLTMGQAYFFSGKHEQQSSFDYFFRKIPFQGGYVVLAGVEEFLNMLEHLHFSEYDLNYLKKLGFKNEFLEYLSGFRFRNNIIGMEEGEIVFPLEPILRVDGGLLECQLVETLLLNVINFQSLVATKASRIRNSAGARPLSDFGLRRAQSLGSLHASRAAIIGGFDSTSNVLAAQNYDISPAGTMAHSFIETFDNELDAFRHYADVFPDNCILLVDTYNTLKSGIPNAIKVAHELEAKGHKLKGIRLDSGDLAYFAKRARKMLNDNGLHYVKIIVSNQLDEYVIKSLLDQGAPIDIFGVGTSMVIGKPDGAIDGVYKLAWTGNKPRLKISDNVQKTTLPGKKIVFRFFDNDGFFYADCIALESENSPDLMIHPFEKEKSLNLKDLRREVLHKPLMEHGKALNGMQNPAVLREKVQKRLEYLAPEHKRFDFPHLYKVGISEALSDLRSQIICQFRKCE